MASTLYDWLLVFPKDEDLWMVGLAYLQHHYYSKAKNINEL